MIDTKYVHTISKAKTCKKCKYKERILSQYPQPKIFALKCLLFQSPLLHVTSTTMIEEKLNKSSYQEDKASYNLSKLPSPCATIVAWMKTTRQLQKSKRTSTDKLETLYNRLKKSSTTMHQERAFTPTKQAFTNYFRYATFTPGCDKLSQVPGPIKRHGYIGMCARPG